MVWNLGQKFFVSCHEESLCFSYQYFSSWGLQIAQVDEWWRVDACFCSTLLSSFRSQLAEANSKASLLFTENERLSHDKKHGYHHDKQLEELRNLQVTQKSC